MMRVFIGILIFLPMLCMAQENLVPNPSFEEYTDCPTGWTHDWSRVVGWSNGNVSSPDYYHVCGLTLPSSPITGVPENAHGSQWPRSGDGYMGLYGVQMGNAEWREYMQVELTEPLFYRIRYAVSFYVSLSEGSRYAISTLGAHLAVDAISSNDLLALDAEPQILPDPLQPITDTTGWVLVTDTFVSAEGGEKYLTIGNFFSDVESDTVFFNPKPPLGNRFAYYYIDDVSVVALDSVPSGIEEQEAFDFSIFPNPATEILNVKSTRHLVQVRLLDMMGRTVLVENMAANKFSVNLSGIPQGVYMLEATDAKGRRATKRFSKMGGL